MTTNRILAALAALLLSAGVAQAAPPAFFTYSGFLTDGAGAPLSGAQTFHFRFHDDPSAGTALGAGEIAVPTTVGGDGFFSVVIDVGALTSDPLFQGQLYMAVRVDPDATPMSPRIQITSVPSALAVPYTGITGFPTAQCPADQYATGFNPGGGFTCAALPPSSGGTVYTGLAPVTVAGSQISMAAADALTSGYLASGDWATFNAKQAALTGPCTAGTYLVGIDAATGTPSCAPIAMGEIASTMLADSAVTGAKIADGSVTLAKLGASGCVAGDVIRWDGVLGWACATAVQSVVTSADLTVNGTAGGTIGSNGTLGLTDTGVPAGTYNVVSVDSKGRVTAGASVETVWLQIGAVGYQTGDIAVTGNISTYSSFVGSLSGNASSATVASSVAGGAIVPGSLATAAAPSVGQVPAADVSGFTWVTPVTGVSPGTGISVSGTGSSPTVSVDSSVPLLAVNNTFTGWNSFTSQFNSFAGEGSGLTNLNASNLGSGTVPATAVTGIYGGITEVGPQNNLRLTTDMNANGNVIRNSVPALIVQSASFQGTVDSFSAGGSIQKTDGMISLHTGTSGAGANAEVKNSAFNITWPHSGPGSFLSFRAYLYYVAAGHTAWITAGGSHGTGQSSGGYGFVISSTAAAGGVKTVEGVTYGMGGVRAASTVLTTALGGSIHTFFATNRGGTIEFYIDGNLFGQLGAAGMNTNVYGTYAVRVGTSDATDAWLAVSQLALSQGL